MQPIINGQPTGQIVSIHNKRIDVPTFFMIANLGGGGSDKYREISHLDLYGNIPILFNYYYLRYPKFATKWLDTLSKYSDFTTFIDFVREDMLYSRGYRSISYTPSNTYSAKNTVIMLDSGAANIIRDLLTGNILWPVPKGTFLDNLVYIMQEYYEFADRYKFDYVIGFDTGGKYSFRDGEKTNQVLIEKYEDISRNKTAINMQLLNDTVTFLLKHPKYYPRVFATVHGDSPSELSQNTQDIISIENSANYKFEGLAIGGCASSKNVDRRWFNGVSVNGDEMNKYLVAKATKIVRSVDKARPIHVLGGGGYGNIPSIYFAGATSYDCQTPARRAYDGSGDNSQHVFNPNASGTFSKYLCCHFNSSYSTINSAMNYDYLKINNVPNAIAMCGCTSCQKASSMINIKNLYSNKALSDEDFYYAKQLCNSHAVWQHAFLSKIVSMYPDIQSLISKYSNEMLFVDSSRVLSII